MKKLFYYLATIIAAFILIACSESKADDSYLNVDPGTLTFSAEGGTASFTIKSNTNWSISMDNSNIQVSPTNGTGDQTVQVTVPASKDVQQKETKLMIKTSNGAVIRNLSVIQEGYLLTGGTLEVTNHSNYLMMNGAKGDLDSLMILSNAPWEIRGPEWIEAYDGNRWVALSPTRAMVSGNATTETDEERTTKLYLRTLSQNEDEVDRNDILTLSQPYSGDLKLEITVLQLGKYRVSSNTYVPLAYGLATDWKCGVGVKTVASRLFLSEVPTAELDNYLSGEESKNWLLCDPEAIASWDNLNEETTYWLYTVGLDENKQYHIIHGIQVFTSSSKNQALATFKNVKYDGGIWHYEIDMNDYCKGFFEWGMIDPETFYWNDPTIAWFFSYMLHDSELTKEFMLWTSFEYGEMEYDGHIQLVTWGVGQDGIKMSGVIDRYRSIDYYEARSEKEERHPVGQAVPKDFKAFKNALIRIK